MLRTLALAAIMASAALVPAHAATTADSVAVVPTLKLGVGSYNPFGDDKSGTAFKAQLHSDFQLLNDVGPLTSIHPFIGVDTTNHGGYYIYAGPAADFALSPSWVLTPSVAVGYYEKGGAQDMGANHLQFQAGAEVAYRFQNGQKVGLELTSTSPWGSHDGSGSEAVTVNYHVPFGVAGMF